MPHFDGYGKLHDYCSLLLPWHYDHHMGKNQNANWGVTTDWVDRLAGTRIKYLHK